MIEWTKSIIKRHWPVLRLRTIIFGTLLFVAALPGVGALFLRVFENSLVRQTEAALIAQGAAIVAVAETGWPGALPLLEKPVSAPLRSPRSRTALHDSLDDNTGYYDLQTTKVDLSAMAILPPRIPATAVSISPDKDAAFVSEKIAPIMAATSQKTLASLQLLDQNGIIVAGFEKGGSLAFLPEVKAALGGKTVTLLRKNGDYAPRYYFEFLSRASGIRLHHARPVVVNGKVRGVLLVTRSPRQLFQGLYQDLGKIMIGTGLIFLVLMGLTAILVRAIIHPLESLSRATRAVTAGQGEIPDRPGLGVVEIRNLYDDFNMMTETIRRRSAYLRDFAASVSHEFKTPLSGIRGGIELLEDHIETMTAAERQRFLRNMTQDADRLSHLVQRLMEMAQADMHMTDPDAHASVNEAILRVADGFRCDGFTITFGFMDYNLEALCPQSTIEAAAATLLENSRQAGADAVIVTCSQDADLVHIDFSDNGPGIPVGDRDRIFDPFFTSKRSEGGTGLGLAIARALVLSSKGTLELLEAGEGACFRLSLRSFKKR